MIHVTNEGKWLFISTSFEFSGIWGDIKIGSGIRNDMSQNVPLMTSRSYPAPSC